MNTNIQNYITKTSTMEWAPLSEAGIDNKGLFVKALRFDNEQQRPPSILLKFEPGAKYPYHNHPGGEELLVLKGQCLVNDVVLNAGDYLYTPPGFNHDVKSETGCELMLMIPIEVVILNK